MRLNLSDLKVGDEVGVVRTGSWELYSEGIYTVTKIDKVKVVVSRAGVDCKRVFSVKRNKELGSANAYSTSYLEAAERQREREECRAKKNALEVLWSNATEAAKAKDLAALEAAVAALKAAQA